MINSPIVVFRTGWDGLLLTEAGVVPIALDWADSDGTTDGDLHEAKHNRIITTKSLYTGLMVLSFVKNPYF
jgi:hypothetical protein